MRLRVLDGRGELGLFVALVAVVTLAGSRSARGLRFCASPPALRRASALTRRPGTVRRSASESASGGGTGDDGATAPSFPNHVHASHDVPAPLSLSSSLAQVQARFKRGMKNSVRKSAYDEELIQLAVPTLAAVLIDPMLSLVDTLVSEDRKATEWNGWNEQSMIPYSLTYSRAAYIFSYTAVCWSPGSALTCRARSLHGTL